MAHRHTGNTINPSTAMTLWDTRGQPTQSCDSTRTSQLTSHIPVSILTVNIYLRSHETAALCHIDCSSNLKLFLYTKRYFSRIEPTVAVLYDDAGVGRDRVSDCIC